MVQSNECCGEVGAKWYGGLRDQVSSVKQFIIHYWQSSCVVWCSPSHLYSIAHLGDVEKLGLLWC